jgi:hypothetical protein
VDVLVGRDLVELRPAWLATQKDRNQMGVEFDCPNHEGLDQLRFWFWNPCDGGPPPPISAVDKELYPRLVYRLGGDFSTLTLAPLGANEAQPLCVYQHWQGYVAYGKVWNALGMPMAW